MEKPDRIPEALFPFLEELRANNNREWFDSRKARYLREVRNPVLEFIGGFGAHLNEISPHFRADPRPVGGSLFRIHRDVRFSSDKSPYKTAFGIQFRHLLGKDAHAPGYYLHLEPGLVFAGMGIWRPDGGALRSIREALVEDPEGWRRVRSAVPGEGAFEEGPVGGPLRMGGDRLKRAPRGFDPDHPLAEDLKWKDFVASRRLDPGAVSQPGFAAALAETYREGTPLMAFLCRALDVPF